jgi:hypothetical protein
MDKQMKRKYPALETVKQEDWEFKTSMGYIQDPISIKKKKKSKMLIIQSRR